MSLPRDDKTKSFVDKFCELGKTIGKASPVEQLIVGGGTGWCIGYLSVKFGKIVALSVGGTLLFLQVASYKYGESSDWADDVENKVKEMRDKFEREILGKDRGRPLTSNQIKRFIRDHTYLTGGFAAGLLLGIGSA